MRSWAMKAGSLLVPLILMLTVVGGAEAQQKQIPQPHKRQHAEPSAVRLGSEDKSKPWWEWEHATGDWGGGRIWLDEHGIVPEILYDVDVFGNTLGGAQTGAAVSGLLDLGLTLETEKLGLWKRGILFLAGQNIVGDTQGVTDEVGDPFNPVTNLLVDGGALADERLLLRADALRRSRETERR